MFPHNLTLEETREVVNAHNALLDTRVFLEADRGDHIIFNYLLNFDGVFPDFVGDEVLDRRTGILRECRGLIFDADTGAVIARRLHKFWNLSQRPETQVGVIDWSAPHIIMDKLDGSMITPFKTSNGIRRWGTKMGDTTVAIPVQEHVAARQEYDEFALMCEIAGFTPIFEWCSRQQRIVIDYAEDQLVLLHVRENLTGAYATREQIRELGDNYGIPVVNVIEATIEDISEFVEHTRALKNAEGYVVHFHNDLMLKLKADEYCMLHNTKEKLNFEKNVVEMVVSDKFDDLLPQLDAGDRAAVRQFADDLLRGATVASNEIREHYMLLESGLGDTEGHERRKLFAELVGRLTDLPHRHYKGLLFKACNYGVDQHSSLLLGDVLKMIKNSTGTATKIEEVRYLMGGIKWSDYRGFFDGDS